MTREIKLAEAGSLPASGDCNECSPRVIFFMIAGLWAMALANRRILFIWFIPGGAHVLPPQSGRLCRDLKVLQEATRRG